MRSLLSILVFVISATVFAQEPVFRGPVNHDGHTISVYGGVGISSATFSNQFIRSLMFDDELDRATFTDQLDELKRNGNRIGGDYELGLIGSYRISKGPHSVMVSVSDGAYAEVSLPSSAIDLAMRGNGDFKGDTVDFSGLNGYGFRYQKIGAGWSMSSKLRTKYWGMLHYLNGEQYVSADVSRSWLYTSELGDTLSASVLGSGSISDTGNVGFTANNGSGIGIDFGFTQDLEGAFSKWRVSAEVRNLGKMYWNKRTIHASYDSNLVWTGLEIPNVNAINSQFEGSQLSDSLSEGIENGLSKQKTSHWLPGSVQVDFMQVKDGGVEVGGGGVARWNSIYRPFAYGRVGYRFSEAVAVHSTIGYGGFGGLQVGLRSIVTLDFLSVYAAINNIEALVVQKKNAGAGAVLNVSYLF